MKRSRRCPSQSNGIIVRDSRPQMELCILPKAAAGVAERRGRNGPISAAIACRGSFRGQSDIARRAAWRPFMKKFPLAAAHRAKVLAAVDPETTPWRNSRRAILSSMSRFSRHAASVGRTTAPRR